MAKKWKSPPPADAADAADPPDQDIPAPAGLVIDGPTAQELAAHGSGFLTQALLVTERADHPDTPSSEAVMTDAAFQARELMMVLALMGVGEAYVESLQRLLGAVHALEKRVFSEEVLAQLKPETLTKLYKLSANEADKRAKYIAGLLATVDGDVTRAKLMSYAPERAASFNPPAKPRRGKKRQRAADREPHPSVLLHEIHTAPDPEEDEENGPT